jgi:hypothetical protein
VDTKDFFIEVSKGNIAGYSFMNKFGRNDSIPNGTWELVSPSSPSGAFPSSGTKVRIKAGGNAADTAEGSGARTITVVGLDSTLTETTEIITTSGANASLATTADFWRVYRAYVSSVGTYGVANTGDIVIEDAGGTVDMLTIMADEGQTQHGAYSIAANKTGYLLSIHIMADALKAADFRLFIRDNLTNVVSPISSKQLKLYFDGVVGQFIYKPAGAAIVLNAVSDIWIEAKGSGANTEVSVDFEILLVDDPSGPIRTM